MSVWRWPSARWGVTVHQGERGDRATLSYILTLDPMAARGKAR